MKLRTIGCLQIIQANQFIVCLIAGNEGVGDKIYIHIQYVVPIETDLGSLNYNVHYT